MNAVFLITLSAAATAVESPVSHGTLAEAASVRYTFDAGDIERATSPDTRTGDPPPATGEYSARKPFGTARTARWTMHAGGGFDLRDSEHRLFHAGVGYSYFIIDRLSLEPQFNVLFLDDERNDAIGGNINLLFRWHMHTSEHWSFYMDAGAGLLGLTDRIPDDGSRFNFTPQAGVGLTFDIGDDMRLMTGLKWHHVSNANLFRDNPGRDSVMAYIGLSLPY